MSVSMDHNKTRRASPVTPLARRRIAYRFWCAEIDNVCLAGCGALVEPPYQVCSAECYDRLTLEVTQYRARVPHV